MIDFWKSLSNQARIGFISGVVLIVIALSVTAWLTMRTDYQVLFSDLKPQDAHAMTEELNRLKTPYKLADSGKTILVDSIAVHPTRLKLMGKDLPLHGAVGLELFNNTDFGMTEFAQKVNYQRALQGEITRTIQSLSEVQDVRVLLALPEQGLFKQAANKPKASITLHLKSGQVLQKNQIAGIQRLVAASVNAMSMQDVTIVDNQGVALTRVADGLDSDTGSRLELKRELEAYLTQKVTAVLDKAYGTGQAVASVDAVLNMEQVKVTTEDVVPGSQRGAGLTAGVMIRERDVNREAPAYDGSTTIPVTGGRGGSLQREVEYAVGRRVEQVISQPGSVRRLQVIAVVRQPLTPAEEEKVRDLVSAAVGAVGERGDTVVVQSLEKVAAQNGNSPKVDDSPALPAPGDSSEPFSALLNSGEPIGEREVSLRLVLSAALALFLGLIVVLWRIWAGRGPVAHPEGKTVMTEAERSKALEQVLAWMNRDGGHNNSSTGTGLAP
ncbi:flagellar basal-body MS-ring/collar protein FliF [Acidovorax facilis]|uniref:flagellar basal-body MS-ring/collar protein FliF n=1 Tax=Acidovorax facilis TaxID=12917 RepID=UPI003CE9B386